MIDRFGKTIQVGWAAHEVLWVEAALTLPKHRRLAAYGDIADMCGRSQACVARKACSLRREKNARVRDFTRKWLRSSDLVTLQPAPMAFGPSSIAPPSRERLMAGRA